MYTGAAPSCAPRAARAPPCPREGLRPPETNRQSVLFDELFSARVSGHRASSRRARAAGKELIVTRHHPPTRTLSAHPDIDQLKRQAKELLRGFTAGDAPSEQEVSAHYHGADRQTFALHDAQLVLARAYGFESWPRLKAFVDGATVRRLVDAVRARNLEQVQRAVEPASRAGRMSMDNFQVVHHAVLARVAGDGACPDGQRRQCARRCLSAP